MVPVSPGERPHYRRRWEPIRHGRDDQHLPWGVALGLTRGARFWYAGAMQSPVHHRLQKCLAAALGIVAMMVTLPAGAQTLVESPVAASKPSPAVHPWVAGLLEKIERGEASKAALECEKAARTAAEASRRLTQGARQACGQAYVALGKRLVEMGAIEAARKQWLLAVQMDPELVTDPEFLALTSAHRRTAPAEEASKEEEPPPVDRRYGTLRKERDAARAKASPAKRVEERSPGPRANQILGVGICGGFDGLAGVHLAWRAHELVTLEMSYGVIFPVVDARVRFHALRTALSPSVGVGMTTPLETRDVFGLGVATYEHLYELGESVHVDVGVSWNPWRSLDVFAGLAFITTVDQQHPDRLIFFPQAAVQTAWFF